MHTPLPWSACKDGECRCGYIFGAYGEVYVAKVIGDEDKVDPYPTAEQQKENTKFILRAVNSHDDLVAACETGAKWMQWWLNHNECECEGSHTCGKTERETELRNMNKALAKAEGREVPHAQQG